MDFLEVLPLKYAPKKACFVRPGVSIRPGVWLGEVVWRIHIGQRQLEIPVMFELFFSPMEGYCTD